MELRFASCFADDLMVRWVFVTAFDLLTRKLQIDNYDAEVRLHCHPKEDEGERGEMDQITDGHFYVNLTPDDPETMLTALAHEMIHVKQYLMGELRKTPDGLFYHGVQIKLEEIPYDKRPWETGAHASMYLLSQWLIQQLVLKLQRKEDVGYQCGESTKSPSNVATVLNVK